MTAGSSIQPSEDAQVGRHVPGFRSPALPRGEREFRRVLSYLCLLASDLAAIGAAFGIAGEVRGDYWLEYAGISVKWLLGTVYLVVTLSEGVRGRQAFGSRLVSAMRAAQSMVVASAITVTILFFGQTGMMLSRLALATAIVLSLVFVIAGRILFLSVFMRFRGDMWETRVLLCDADTAPSGIPGDIVYLGQEGLTPDVRDPEVLARLGEYASKYDHIAVYSPDLERRAAWTFLLGSFDTHGEVLLTAEEQIGAIGIDRIGPYETLVITRGTLSLANRFKKRLFDIGIAGLALVVLSPLLLVTYVAVRFESRGPGFFRQPRVGFHNRTFRIFKFRSMRSEASDIAGGQSTRPDDERITRVGRFIRKTSIDELPQLLNVLLGDMSMVGPRPHALGSLAGDQLFWEVDASYWKRHSLKPGITGLAQIRGFRGATHQREDLVNRLAADTEYINGWSIWRDIRILILTARVLVHQNAY